MTLPYLRALHPDDYTHPDLAGYVQQVNAWEGVVQKTGVPYRKDHEHRVWEYASVLRAMTELAPVPLNPDVVQEKRIKVLDTGAGANYFSSLLASLHYDVMVNDSMAYGDCTEWYIAQCQALGLQLPINRDPVEALTLPEHTFDVTLCISVIEHIPDAAAAFQQLLRVTRPGGLIILTSDYFRDVAAWEVSKFRSIQHTVYTPAYFEALVRNEVAEYSLVGPLDPTYRGDFVNNYSFVTWVFQKSRRWDTENP